MVPQLYGLYDDLFAWPSHVSFDDGSMEDSVNAYSAWNGSGSYLS